MEKFSKDKACTIWCWIIAAVTGAVVALVLWVKLHWNFVTSEFVGLLIFIIGGALLSWLLCKPQARSSSSSATEATAPSPVTAATNTSVVPSVLDPVISAESNEKQTAGETALAGKPALAMAAASAAGTTTKVKTAAKPRVKKVAAKPARLTAARDGVADDLKQLKGVGPALERTLNELGFYHFDQVAAWKKKDVAWVDSNLRFKGRIERDGWIAQAKILAKNGTTEFSNGTKKGGV
jgi:predicted flap endonuclease-1-like 5' DNA nuclease